MTPYREILWNVPPAVMAGVYILSDAAALWIAAWFARRPWRARLLILAPFVGLGALPYLADFALWGGPLWEASAAAHGATPATWHAPLGLGRFLQVFFETVPEQWAAVGPSDPIELAGAAAITVVFVLSLQQSRLARCVLLALGATLLIHVTYEYRGQLRLGIWPGSYGAAPRYYLPLWPAVAFGCALAFGRAANSRLRNAAATAFLVLVGYGFPLTAAIRYPLLH